MHRRSLPLSLVAAAAIALGACGGSDGEAQTDTETQSESGGIRVVSPAEGAAIIEDPPDELVILDVRTPEEFDAGHLPGATELDFYAPDFADRLAELDPDAPYVLYCKSGNRSGQTRAMMADLGFADVSDIDGGYVAWTAAGLPVEG